MRNPINRRMALLAGASLGALGVALPAQAQAFDAAAYPLALDQLSGRGYAAYVESYNSLGYHYNAILDRATDCEIPPLAGLALECRTSPIHLWGQIDYQWRKKDGDLEVTNYHADRWSALLGFDVNVSSLAVLGLSVGKVDNDVDLRDSSTSSIKGDGWQLGAYGVFDPGRFYIKALTTYSSYDGEARRIIDFTPFGGTIVGEVTGDPDVRLWTFGLHGGYRIPMGPTSVITPFLNYDYTNAKLRDFREGGATGAELIVNGGGAKHSWLTGGVKWAGQFGGIVPEAKLGYRHMFGDRRESFSANFVGFEEDRDFDILSTTEKAGAVIAGLAAGGKIGMVDMRIGYEGAYNNDVTEHSAFLKLIVPLGGSAPEPLLPPPPPATQATQTCPDGTAIVATEMCPAPPPPPPPAAPPPERG